MLKDIEKEMPKRKLGKIRTMNFIQDKYLPDFYRKIPENSFRFIAPRPARLTTFIIALIGIPLAFALLVWYNATLYTSETIVSRVIPSDYSCQVLTAYSATVYYGQATSSAFVSNYDYVHYEKMSDEYSECVNKVTLSDPCSTRKYFSVVNGVPAQVNPSLGGTCTFDTSYNYWACTGSYTSLFNPADGFISDLIASIVSVLPDCGGGAYNLYSSGEIGCGVFDLQMASVPSSIYVSQFPYFWLPIAKVFYVMTMCNGNTTYNNWIYSDLSPVDASLFDVTCTLNSWYYNSALSPFVYLPDPRHPSGSIGGAIYTRFPVTKVTEKYIFTNANLQACRAMYPKICASYFYNNPPYLCTRKTYLPPLTVIANAFSNTLLVYAVFGSLVAFGFHLFYKDYEEKVDTLMSSEIMTEM